MFTGACMLKGYDQVRAAAFTSATSPGRSTAGGRRRHQRVQATQLGRMEDAVAQAFHGSLRAGGGAARARRHQLAHVSA